LFRKLIAISTAALAIGALTVTPLIAQAGPNAAQTSVVVTANVDATATVVTSGNVVIPWTRTAEASQPLTVGVTTNDTEGYNFTFTSAHQNGDGKFYLLGAASNSYIPYTISGPNGDSSAYSSGSTANPFTYFSPSLGNQNNTAFNVNLASQTGVAADTYSDTLYITVNTL